MALIKCPECGKEVLDEVTICPECGYEIVSQCDAQCQKKDVPIYRNKKTTAIALWVVACSCFIIAFTRVNNDDYAFYKGHYQTCMEGYSESKSTANAYNGGLFKSSYNYIQTNYQGMGKQDNEKLWEYRIQAIILCVGGIFCVILGYKKYNKGVENHGISKMS